MSNKIVVLGGGVAGISFAHHLALQKKPCIVYEKDSTWGGLCGFFEIDGFRFDRFVHLSFAENEYIKNTFSSSSKLFEHIPLPSNYYKGMWLRHPAQNNLFPLPNADKVKVLKDFIERPQKNQSEIIDYSDWLYCQYGQYFAEHFPFPYTRKYWGVEPHELETRWVGQRMYVPDLEEVLTGAFETQDKCFYYAKVMKYPETGGFRSILNSSREGLDIRCNKQVIRIDPTREVIYFSDDSSSSYDTIVSSLPLPDVIASLPDVPEAVVSAAKQLQFTSGYQVSFGFNKPDIPKHLWFYIYDEDVLSSRVYSPSLKSPDNAPAGCSSLQAEIFWSNSTPAPDIERALENTLVKFLEMGLFKEEDILVKDIRFEKYANIIFNHDIYDNRKKVLDYLSSLGIHSIGRFGQWEYMWSHQAYEQGMQVAEEMKRA